jgi:hypothetical protein
VQACTLLEGLNKGLAKVKVQSSVVEDQRGTGQVSADDCSTKSLNKPPALGGSTSSLDKALSACSSAGGKEEVHVVCCSATTGAGVPCSSQQPESNKNGQRPCCMEQH